MVNEHLLVAMVYGGLFLLLYGLRGLWRGRR